MVDCGKAAGGVADSVGPPKASIRTKAAQREMGLNMMVTNQSNGNRRMHLSRRARNLRFKKNAGKH